ncbi:MAG: hypothetical protein ACRD1H_03105, partial [Vicinamibacterales bacterium]
AYRVDVSRARITFTFLPNQRVPKQQCEDARGWLESLAEKVAGMKIPVSVAVAEAAPAAPPTPAASAPLAAPAGPAAPAAPAKPRSSEEDLRKQAMADPAVQALLEIFPVEKTKIEEI